MSLERITDLKINIMRAWEEETRRKKGTKEDKNGGNKKKKRESFMEIWEHKS